MRRLLFPALLLLASAYALPEAAQAQENIATEELADMALPPSELAKAREFISAEDLAVLRQSAREGWSFDQYTLGLMYAEGKGVPQSDTQAVYWIRLAAEQDNSHAQTNLGLRYMVGEGVPQDYAQGARWLRLAAEWGNQEAQSRLGLLYLEGQGVPKNYVASYIWADLAAAQGDEFGLKIKETVAELLTPVERYRARRLSEECYRQDYRNCTY